MKNQSQIFDFGRFSLYLRREFMLNGRQWLFRGLMMLALTTLLLCFFAWPNRYWLETSPSDYNYASVQSSAAWKTLIIGIVCFVALGGFLFMENLNTSGKRLNTIMLPASTFEKYTSGFLIYVLGIWIAFFISFAIADAIRLVVISLTFGNIEGLSYVGPFGAIATFHILEPWLVVFAVQATAVLGSTVWPKNPAPKTIGIVFVLFCLWTMLLTFIFSNTMRGKVMSESGSNAIEYTISALTVIWTLFSYVTAYFRMKESEIIHRL